MRVSACELGSFSRITALVARIRRSPVLRIHDQRAEGNGARGFQRARGELVDLAHALFVHRVTRAAAEFAWLAMAQFSTSARRPNAAEQLIQFLHGSIDVAGEIRAC